MLTVYEPKANLKQYCVNKYELILSKINHYISLMTFCLLCLAVIVTLVCIPNDATSISIKSALLTVFLGSILIMVREVVKEKHEKYILIKSLIAELTAVIAALTFHEVELKDALTRNVKFPYFTKIDFNYFSYYDSAITKLGLFADTELLSNIIKSYISAKATFSYINYLSEEGMKNQKIYEMTGKQNLLVIHKQLTNSVLGRIRININKLNTLKTRLEKLTGLQTKLENLTVTDAKAKKTTDPEA